MRGMPVLQSPTPRAVDLGQDLYLRERGKPTAEPALAVVVPLVVFVLQWRKAMFLNPGESQPSFTDLFNQLGLESDPDSIARFIQQHRPLPEGMEIYDAPFWSPQQGQLLKETLKCDADWAIVVDQLNAALHEKPDLDQL